MPLLLRPRWPCCPLVPRTGVPGSTLPTEESVAAAAASVPGGSGRQRGGAGSVHGQGAAFDLRLPAGINCALFSNHSVVVVPGSATRGLVAAAKAQVHVK